MEIILHAIQGLGGTVLKSNVDLERAKLIQSTLTTASADRDGKRGTENETSLISQNEFARNPVRKWGNC
jgi:hypothetical protein